MNYYKNIGGFVGSEIYVFVGIIVSFLDSFYCKKVAKNENGPSSIVYEMPS